MSSTIETAAVQMGLKVAADTRPLVGPKILLMGPSGTGKTYAIGTLTEWAKTNGKEVFVLFTENGLETLLGFWRDKDLPVPDCLHWHQQLTVSLSLTSLIEGADKVGKYTYKMLTEMQDVNRGGDSNSFWKILTSCKDFKDDRTGKAFGAVDSFGADRIFVIDSLSELSTAAMKMQVGNKPMAAPQDYGVAQQYIISFLRLLTQGTNCTFAITAHVDRILDPVSQTTKIMVKSAGKALADEIPQLFSDVIYTVREADKFYWDTAAFGVDSKTRSLGYRSKIEPNFALIMDLWKKRAAT
jgi:hypothetical protein